MGDRTGIQWTDATWNPVTGCSKVSDGCRNCYADDVARRFWGERKFTDVRCHEERLDQPLRWQRPRRVFVNSMSDLFHDHVPDDFIDDVFATMLASPRHTFQVLTKRPKRMCDYMQSRARALHDPHGEIGQRVFDLRAALDGHRSWPAPNVWLGVSVEDQRTANERIPMLLQTPAAVRFISAEPLIGPLSLMSSIGGTRWIGGQRGCGSTHRGIGSPDCPKEPHHHHDELCKPGLDWVIVGGESGPGARHCDIEWIRSVVQQCRHASTACFVKQLGCDPYGDESGWILQMKDRKGSDPDEWPEDLRVREFPKEVARG